MLIEKIRWKTDRLRLLLLPIPALDTPWFWRFWKVWKNYPKPSVISWKTFE